MSRNFIDQKYIYTLGTLDRLAIYFSIDGLSFIKINWVNYVFYCIFPHTILELFCYLLHDNC